jgi:hypothetical protein
MEHPILPKPPLRHCGGGEKREHVGENVVPCEEVQSPLRVPRPSKSRNMWLAATAVVAAAMLAIAPPTLTIVSLALAVIPLAILAISVCHCLLRCTTTTHHATAATIAATAPATATPTTTAIAAATTLPTNTTPSPPTYIHSHVCSGHQDRHNRLPLLRAAKVVGLTTPRSTPICTEEHGRELLDTLAVGQARKLHPLDPPVAASSHAAAAASRHDGRKKRVVSRSALAHRNNWSRS